MPFEAKPNTCGLFDNTRNDKSDLTGGIKIECPQVPRDFRVVAERVAQDFAERAGLDQPRAEAEGGKRNSHHDCEQ